MLRDCKVTYNVIGSNWSIDEKYSNRDKSNNNNNNNNNNNIIDWNGFGFSAIYSNDKAEVLVQSEKMYGNDIIYADIPIAIEKK